MKLGVLYSGGKDSTLALHKAAEHNSIACLITIISSNKESYMFQTQNVDVTLLQSQALGLPLVRVNTKGVKEEELKDLKNAIIEAKEKYGVEGIVTGAVRSTYQASRVQRICHDLGLWCFNPLWLKNQVELLKEIASFTVVISGVYAEGLDESFLGAEIDSEMISKLSLQFNPAGEGGEIETTVLDAPMFKKKIVVTKDSKSYANYSGDYVIEDAKLVEK